MSQTSKPQSEPAGNPNGTAKPGLIGRFLNTVERIGNLLPDPLVLFVLMMAAVPVASAIASWSGWTRIHPVTGETVAAVNLLNAEGITRMLTTAVGNFTSFPPLGIVLVAMLGIGLAERSGFLAAALRGFVAVVPKPLLTGALVLGGVLSNLAVDAGYVVLVPMGAVLFAGVGRHPLAGMAAAFAGVSGGFSANLVITSLDPLLAGFTNAAAHLFDPGYHVEPTGNFYFMLASTALIVGAGWFVTERIVEPRLGKWTPPESFSDDPGSPVAPGATERRALAAAFAAAGIAAAIVILLFVPEGAMLRDEEGGLKPFYDALIPLLAVLFIIPGLVFGILTRTIRRAADISRMLSETMAGMGGYLVLAFVASQFVAYFQWSNLGLLVALAGADVLRSSGAGPIPLLLGIIALSGTVNLFVGSASAKWGLMAPVLVPMMMALGFSPELAQAAFRIGDSTTNIITPLLPYFPIILAFGQRYVPNLGLGTLVSIMLPYSVAFSIAWAVQLIVWFTLGWPLGPGAPLMLPQ